LRTHADVESRTGRIRAATLLAADALLAGLVPAALAKRDASGPADVEVTQEPGGFVISQDLDVSGAVRDEYERALQHLQRGQNEQGIELLLKVTEALPGAIAPHVDLGIAYGRTGAEDLAEASLKRALALDPGHPIVNNELGMLYRRTGRFAEARASYEKALELYPSFHFAHRNLAILCDLYLQDFKCALEHYEAYRQAVPGDPEPVKWMADVRGRAGGEDVR